MKNLFICGKLEEHISIILFLFVDIYRYVYTIKRDQSSLLVLLLRMIKRDLVRFVIDSYNKRCNCTYDQE